MSRRALGARALLSMSPMKNHQSIIPVCCLLAAGLGLLGGCRHTGEGIKDDTKNAVHKTGEGLEKAGEKLKGEDKK